MDAGATAHLSLFHNLAVQAVAVQGKDSKAARPLSRSLNSRRKFKVAGLLSRNRSSRRKLREAEPLSRNHSSRRKAKEADSLVAALALAKHFRANDSQTIFKSYVNIG